MGFSHIGRNEILDGLRPRESARDGFKSRELSAVNAGRRKFREPARELEMLERRCATPSTPDRARRVTADFIHAAEGKLSARAISICRWPKPTPPNSTARETAQVAGQVTLDHWCARRRVPDGRGTGQGRNIWSVVQNTLKQAWPRW